MTTLELPVRGKLSLFFLLTLVAVSAPSAAAADMITAASSLSFNAVLGTNPPAQSFAVTTTASVSTSFSPSVSVTTTTGGNWLSASVAAGTNSAIVTAQVNSQGLPAGTYSGQITVTASGLTNSPATVTVQLTVTAGGGASLSISPGSLRVSAATGVNANSQVITISTNGGGAVAATLSASTSNGVNWLSVSQPIVVSGSSSATAQVTFNTSALAAGTYTGTITASGSGATSVSATVTLTVGASVSGPSLSVSPGSISFSTSVSTNPASATLSINNNGTGSLAAAASASTSSGGSWLTVTLSAAGTGGSRTATVSANVSGMAAGTFNGTVTITDPTASNSPMNIPVTLNIQASGSAGLTLGTKTVSLLTPSSTVQVSTNVGVTSDAGSVGFTTSVSTSTGGTWLSVSASSSTTPATLTISGNATGLASGVYSGTVTVTPSGSSASQNIAVTLGVAVSLPVLNVGGIVNGASFLSLNVAPGEIVSAFGANLGPTVGVNATASAGSLPTTLGGVRVTFDGTAGAMFFASNGQLNVQVPFEVAGRGAATVLVSNNGTASGAFTLQLRGTDPAIFVAANGRAAILNSASAQVTASTAATAGDNLSIFATGMGSVDGTIATGQLAPASPLLNTTGKATVTVGGANAEVTFSGLAPGFAGLYQVNFKVPAGLAAGDQPLTLGIAGNSSVTLPLAVR